MEVEAIGVICLGIFVALFVVWIIETKMPTITPTGLGIILGSIFGGAVATFLAVEEDLIMYYPIGLVIGFVGYFILKKIR